MEKKSLFWFIVIVLILIQCFLFLTYSVVNNGVDRLDQYVIDLVKPFQSDFLTKVMKVFSYIGNTMPVIIISLILLLIFYKIYKKWHEVVLFIVVLVGSTAINQALKFIIKRERPLSRLIDEGGFSYPSGHTMAAVSLYGIITFILWRHVKTATRRVLLVVFSCFMIIFIAISRIYLGVHYTTDILGAFLVSGTWLYITIWVYQYRIEKEHEK